MERVLELGVIIGKMHKSILIVALILGVLLIGCKVAEEPVEEGVEAVSGPEVEIYEQISEKEPAPKKAEPELPPLSQELLDLIAKAEGIGSIEYSYGEYKPGEAGIFMHVYVREDKIKQVFSIRGGTYTPGTMYDSVYLDLAEKTVKAYCEDIEDCEDTDALIPVNYNDFIVETPLSLLRTIKYGEIKGSAMFGNREAIIIEFINEQGNKQRVWLWNYWGVPIKYEIYSADGERIKKVEYKGMIVNQLKSSDFVHKSK